MDSNILKRFISLEGGEGAGKTTVAKEVKNKLEDLGYKVYLTREPGGSNVAESIREIIMNNELDIETEALLFAAARLDHINNIVLNKLKEGYFVICDRYVDSSIVYQEYVGGCKSVRDYNKFVLENYMPFKTFFFDVSVEIGLERVFVNEREKNRFDKRNIEFHNNVYKAYKDLAQKEKRIITIDASKSVQEVSDVIISNLDI